jgi:hypothetical protein
MHLPPLLLAIAVLLVAGCSSRPDPVALTVTVGTPDQAAPVPISGTWTVDGMESTTTPGQMTPLVLPLKGHAVTGSWSTTVPEAILVIQAAEDRGRPLTKQSPTGPAGSSVSVEMLVDLQGYTRVDGKALPAPTPAAPAPAAPSETPAAPQGQTP